MVTIAGRGEGKRIILAGAASVWFVDFFGEACPTKYEVRLSVFDLSRVNADLIVGSTIVDNNARKKFLLGEFYGLWCKKNITTAQGSRCCKITCRFLSGLVVGVIECIQMLFFSIGKKQQRSIGTRRTGPVIDLYRLLIRFDYSKSLSECRPVI